MAALAIIAFSGLQQLWDLSNAFVHRGYNLSKTFRYLRLKQRELVFRKLCRAVWLRELSISKVDALQQEQLQSEQSAKLLECHQGKLRTAKNSVPIEAMQRHRFHPKNTDGIDFAAMEATALAYEAIDTFAAGQPPGKQQSRRRSGQDEDRFSFDVVDNFDDIEVISATEVDATFYEYSDAIPIYSNTFSGQLQEGVSFRFNGYLLRNCERFSINFVIENETRDVALHINPRLPQNYIVRNTKVNEVWGREEVSSALPFSLHRGTDFSIQVLVTTKCYMISVNGLHFAKYFHRLPYKAVSSVEVRGDVDNICMERSIVSTYPERLPNSEPEKVGLALCYLPLDQSPNADTKAAARHTKSIGILNISDDYDEVDGSSIPHNWRVIGRNNPVNLIRRINENDGLPLPYFGALPENSLYPGRCLKIEGRAKLLPHSFYINLQKGVHFWPHPIIAFHFNPRFSKHSGAVGKSIVCRNAWFDGDWGQEERSELDIDFLPGKTFRLVIICRADAFEVYVNGKLVTEFRYQVKPDVVDTVYIQGDIKLWNVVLQNNVSPKGRKRLYSNPGYTPIDD